MMVLGAGVVLGGLAKKKKGSTDAAYLRQVRNTPPAKIRSHSKSWGVSPNDSSPSRGPRPFPRHSRSPFCPFLSPK